MGDRRRSNDKSWKVFACADLNNIYQVTIPLEILCISPVLRGYIEQPDTTPPGVQRNGTRTLSLNNEGEVVRVMLEYLRQAHVDGRFKLDVSDGDAVFFVRLYKLALSLGLDHLCILALRMLHSQTRKVEDFAKAAIEASQRGLIDGQRFRRWFTTYVHQRHDELIERLAGNTDEMKFCRLLVSALALSKDDYERQDAATPSNLPPAAPASSSKKRQADLAPGLSEEASSKSLSDRRETSSSTAKKPRYNPSVEDAPESDEEDASQTEQVSSATQ